MDLRRFFSEEKVRGSIIDIVDEEAYHLRKVLRVKKGTVIEITDGKGVLHYGKVDSFSGENVRVWIERTERFKKTERKIIIAASLLKRTPMNFMIEKLTEIGVDEITPIIFNRTELKPSEKVVKKWEKIAIASIKVNKRPWLTKVNSPIAFDELIEKYTNINRKYMLDIQGKKKLSVLTDNIRMIAVIGPPGDYIQSEREVLFANGYEPIKISNSILKVETAAISVSAILKEKEFFY
jgi:16S rRNA (uracil1498-N3)-methyltransferase